MIGDGKKPCLKGKKNMYLDFSFSEKKKKFHPEIFLNLITSVFLFFLFVRYLFYTYFFFDLSKFDSIFRENFVYTCITLNEMRRREVGERRESCLNVEKADDTKETKLLV